MLRLLQDFFAAELCYPQMCESMKISFSMKNDVPPLNLVAFIFGYFFDSAKKFKAKALPTVTLVVYKACGNVVNYFITLFI